MSEGKMDQDRDSSRLILQGSDHPLNRHPDEAPCEMTAQNDNESTSPEAIKLVIARDAYTQAAFDHAYKEPPTPGTPLSTKIRKQCFCSKERAWRLLTMYFPVIRFAKKYHFRNYLLGDFLSGLTVSFMHLPQAMGFGILASLRPVHGLYSTFFPVLFYLLFGTSPYISFGTNAVMALLTETAVEREADAFIAAYVPAANDANSTTGPTEDEILAIKVGTAMACSFIAGIFLTGMGILRLGFITTYLSVSFVGGFTTAAAVHIASSQVPKMFGIKTVSHSGAGKLILMYIDLFSKIAKTKPAEIIISILSMAVLLIVKICVNEKYSSKMKMPIPIDLLVVVVGTIISHFAKFKDVFDVSIVGNIPSGFAEPAVPRFANAGNFVSDAIVMGILSLAMSISMAKLTAKKHSIQIDDNQELIAYGASNMFSSFFSCFPAATAPPRTMILSSLGARTTLNGIPTAVFMLLVILVIGPLFTSLPLSVLAAMIIVSMKDLLLQYRNIPSMWKVNKYDFIIWVVTNSVGVLADLNYGVIAGVAVSVFLVVIQNQLVSGQVIGISQSEDLLLVVNQHKNVKQYSGFKIFKFPTSLYFATAERFKSEIYKEVLNPQKYKKMLKSYTIVVKNDKEQKNSDVKTMDEVPFSNLQKVQAVIIDCSAMAYIDMGGTNMLQQVIKEYKDIDVSVYLAGLLDGARKVLTAADFFETFPTDQVFVDIFDAIAVLKGSMETSSDILKM